MGRDGVQERGDEALIEVLVERDEQPYTRVELGAGRFTFGRDAGADVCLSSKHVSRTHFTLVVSSDEVRVLDAGSRNGIKVDHRKVSEAVLEPGQAVTVPEFAVAFQWLDRRDATSPDTPSDVTTEPDLEPGSIGGGWDEYFEDSGGVARREVTNVTAKPESATPTRKRASTTGTREERRSTGSLSGSQASVLSRRETGDRMRVDYAGDGEKTGEDMIRPAVLTLELLDEASSVRRGTNEGDIAVEVILTAGDRVMRMELLSPGQSFWWGKRPGLSRLWREATADSFPLVSYTREGAYRVRHPDDPAWSLFQGGERAFDTYSSGPLTVCDAKWEDQFQVRYGPHSFHIRCVRVPRMERRLVEVRRLIPDRVALIAVVLSGVLHAGFVALPGSDSAAQPVRLLNDREEFVELRMPDPETPPEPEPEKKPKVKDAEKPRPKDEPKAKIRSAKKAKPPEAPPSEAPVRDEAAGQKTKPVDTPDPAAAPVAPKGPEEDKPPARAPPSSIGVADFKITGMMTNLPELRLETGKGRRGRRQMLSGAASKGVVTKNPNLMGIEPIGTLSNEEVGKVVNASGRDVVACYTRILDSNPTARGQVVVQWTVDLSGKVVATRVVKDTVGSTGLLKCLRQVITGWTFPAPHGGHAQVTYPFTFQRPKL